MPSLGVAASRPIESFLWARAVTRLAEHEVADVEGGSRERRNGAEFDHVDALLAEVSARFNLRAYRDATVRLDRVDRPLDTTPFKEISTLWRLRVLGYRLDLLAARRLSTRLALQVAEMQRVAIERAVNEGLYPAARGIDALHGRADPVALVFASDKLKDKRLGAQVEKLLAQAEPWYAKERGPLFQSMLGRSAGWFLWQTGDEAAAWSVVGEAEGGGGGGIDRKEIATQRPVGTRTAQKVARM